MKLELEGKAKADLGRLAEKLKSLSHLTVLQEKDAVSALAIEVKDIKGNPYVYIIYRFFPDKLEVHYSVPESESIGRRTLRVLQQVLSLLSYLSGLFEVPPENFLTLVLDALNREEEAREATSVDYEKLKAKEERLRKRLAEMEERLRQASLSLYQLKSRNDELERRLKKLEGMSDEALKSKLMEWIKEHNGEIDVAEFSKLYGLVPSRVEEALDQLVKEGYLEVESSA